MGLTNQESAVINQVAGQLNKASQMHKGQAQKLRNLGKTKQAPPGYHYMPDGSLMANSEHNLGYANFGNSISGKTAAYAITGAVIGNTLIARTLGTKWLDSLDVGFMTAGLATAAAGGFTVANGIPDEDLTKLAAGGALMGLGLFYIGAGK